MSVQSISSRFWASALALAVMASFTTHAAEESVPTLVAKAPAGSEVLMTQVRKIIADLPVESVTAAELPGFYLLELSDGQLLYGSADGRYLFAGELYSLQDSGVVNVTEERRAGKRKRLMDAQPVDSMVVFSPAGETKTYVSVFTDVDCGYCRQLHQQMAQINALGIEVRYLAYPRAGLDTPTAAKIVSAWCADDPNGAITALKSGLEIPSKECANPVAEQYALGQQVGVTGTPAIVTADGRLLPGYMPAQQLAQAIGL